MLSVKKPLLKRCSPVVLSVFIGGLLFVVDRWLKTHALNTDRLGTCRDLIEWRLFRNHEGVFGLNIALPFLIVCSFLILFGVIWYQWKTRLIPSIAFACLLAGAVANLIDRLWFESVIDVILFGCRSAWNLADFSILFGVTWWLISLIFDKEKSIPVRSQRDS